VVSKSEEECVAREPERVRSRCNISVTCGFTVKRTMTRLALNRYRESEYVEKKVFVNVMAGNDATQALTPCGGRPAR
jgi:hypothetical protein